MKHLRLLLDSSYDFSSQPLGERFLYLRNDGMLFQINFHGLKQAISLLRREKRRTKYIKIILLPVFCVFKKTLYSEILYSYNIDVILVLFGKSGKVKLFKNSCIVNEISDEWVSKNEWYIRKRISGLGIAPKILDSGKKYYVEERIKTTRQRLSDKDKMNLLEKYKSVFRCLSFDQVYYLEKLRNGILKSRPDLYSVLSDVGFKSEGSILVRMSHGDFLAGNILQKKDGTLYLVDFEFMGYRSDSYDMIYSDYYGNNGSLPNHILTKSHLFFFLERLHIIVRLSEALGRNYEIEIAKILRSIEELNNFLNEK